MRLPRRGDHVLVFTSTSSGRTVCRVRLRQDEYETLRAGAARRMMTIEDYVVAAVKEAAKNIQ